MTGRGIDQILPFPSNPNVYEPYVSDAREYVQLAEEKNGAIEKPVNFDYIWGDALNYLEKLAPHFRIVNLETSITTSEDYLEGKQINYRMNPKNTPCLTAAKIDCCVLANNHVLDWGYSGLAETLDTLKMVGIKKSGAGRNNQESESPTVLEIQGKGRVLVFSFGSETSGVPLDWAATENKPGINVLGSLSNDEIRHIQRLVETYKRQNDIVLVSIHWGSNWGYQVPDEQQSFAHNLIDEADVDLIHGHSSHHPKGMEVYKNKLILYGCGDFLNDYEGIGTFEDFRGDLGLMYFAILEANSGNLQSLQMIPTQIKNLKVNNPSKNDVLWLIKILKRESKKFGCNIEFRGGYLWLKGSFHEP